MIYYKIYHEIYNLFRNFLYNGNTYKQESNLSDFKTKLEEHIFEEKQIKANSIKE